MGFSALSHSIMNEPCWNTYLLQTSCLQKMSILVNSGTVNHILKECEDNFRTDMTYIFWQYQNCMTRIKVRVKMCQGYGNPSEKSYLDKPCMFS